MALSAASLVKGSRQRSGLSLRAVAERAGLPVSTVHRIEQGRMNPSIRVLERIGRALGSTLRLELREDPSIGLVGWAASASRTSDPRTRVRLAAELSERIVRADRRCAEEMLSIEPAPFSDDRWDGFTAALAEHLCQRAGVGPPAWTASWTSRPPEPWWVVDVRSVRAIVWAATPLPFKLRGIYVERAALVNE